jgi:hypothetical protein
MKINENPFSGFRVVSVVQTDGRNERFYYALSSDTVTDSQTDRHTGHSYSQMNCLNKQCTRSENNACYYVLT